MPQRAENDEPQVEAAGNPDSSDSPAVSNAASNSSPLKPDGSVGEEKSVLKEQAVGSGNRTHSFLRWTGAGSKWLGGVAAGVAVGVLTPVAIMVINHVTASSSPEVPLTAAVQPGVGACPSWWIISPPGPAGALMPEPGHAPAGAVLSSSSWIGLTLQAMRGHTVVIQSMRAEVVTRHKSVSGVQIPAAICQGNTRPSYFAFDLKHDSPLAVPISGWDGSKIPPAYFPFVVREDAPEQFYIKASVASGEVLWRIIVRWSSDGRQGDLTVRDNGRPLKISAGDRAPMLCQNPSTGRWTVGCVFLRAVTFPGV